MPNTGRKIDSLTGLRAIAAFLVFFHHYTPSADIVGVRLFSMFWQGHIGVSVFFVLSGFLIALNYYDSVQLSRVWIFRFLRNRFARIYPMYFITSVAAYIIVDDYRVKAWILNLTFLRGFFKEYYFYHIGQAWSLSVEVVFYLLAPLLLKAICRIPLGVLCLVFYSIAYLCASNPNIFGTNDFFYPHRMVVINTFFGRCFEFLFGMWIYVYFKNSLFQDKYSKISWITYLGLIGSLFIFYELNYCPGIAVYCAPCAPIVHYLLPLFIGIFILGLWKESSYIGQILSTKLFVILGCSSYIFYLIHAAPFVDLPFNIGIFTGPTTIESMGLIPHFLIINIISIVLYYLIERPFHRLLREK